LRTTAEDLTGNAIDDSHGDSLKNYWFVVLFLAGSAFLQGKAPQGELVHLVR
jgi:hypothetical protein